MKVEQFITYLEHPEILDEKSLVFLREMLGEYPYFPAVRMLYLRNLKNIDSYKFEDELQKNAVFIPDRRILYSFIHDDAYADRLDPQISDKKEADSSALEQFPVKNYGMFDLEREYGEAPIGSNEEDLIDRFIMSNPTILSNGKSALGANSKKKKEKNPLDEGLITETLADIYEKQGLYSEAISAYEKLSLKFPEKNSYFASRIEKIKNLISKDL